MQIIKAKILDPTHLRLNQPISAQPGDSVLISISDGQDEDHVWQEAARKHFLIAYDDRDAIYDQL